jgi:hypothetical protein
MTPTTKPINYPPGEYVVYFQTGYVNANHYYEDLLVPEDFEMDEAEWNALTDGEREKMMDEVALDFRNEQIECGVYTKEDHDNSSGCW